MKNLFDIHVYIVLKHILDREPTLVDSEDEEDSGNDGTIKSRDAHSASVRQKSIGGNKRKIALDGGADFLDFEGPKLIHGLKNWLVFYQLIGQINFIGRPLYESIIYKLLICALLSYNLIFRYLQNLYNLHLIKETFRNPIFLFISFLACATFIAQVIVSLYVNLFDLCPLYKILITPKLCFVKKEVMHILGTRTMGSVLLVHLYNTVLLSMLLARDFSDFIDSFDFATFLLDYYLLMVCSYHLIGLSHLDLYVRSVFGHWLLALKSHLELQFTYLHRQQRRSMRQCMIARSADGNQTGIESGISEIQRRRPPRLITFNEVQKNLNHMDDHLEVWRSVQNGSIVLATLNAFLANGALFLLTYHIIADQANYYHGCLLVLLSVSYIVAVFFGYSGDRWVYYALNSFVQTVEDEYFMQNDIKLSTASVSRQEAPSSIDASSPALAQQSSATAALEKRTGQVQQMLLIKKKDVLFCREFLHQFENHLATPWSKLTLKSHLHMLRTFVTLVAAQIIFDDEH